MGHTETIVNGKRWPSVSEISSVAMGGDYLFKYYAKNGILKADLVLKALGKTREDVVLSPEAVEAARLTVDDFWKDAEQLKNEAANRGIAKHEIFEKVMTALLGQGEFPQDEYSLLFQKWVEGKKFKAKSFEEKVLCPQYEFGGTYDALFTTDSGREVVADFKFANRIKANYIIQLAGYNLALGGQRRAGYILRFGETVRPAKATERKETTWGYKYVTEGSRVYLEEACIDDLSKFTDVFLACLVVRKFLNSY